MEFRTLLQLLWRKWWLLALAFVITVSATAIFTIQQPRRYESKTTFVAKLNRDLIDDRGLTDALDILGRRTEIVTTYAEVIKSRRVKDLAAELLDLSPLQRSGLLVDSRVVAGTTIIELTVEGNDPTVARDYAQMVGEVTFTYVDNLYEMYELALLDEATFGKPLKSNLVVNLVIAAAASLILGCGLILLPELLRQWRQEFSATPVLVYEMQNVTALQKSFATLQAQLELSQQTLQKFSEHAAANPHQPPSPLNSTPLLTPLVNETGPEQMSESAEHGLRADKSRL